MVGVPGRSKGCITCRRRKIRCDETKPNCQKCVDTGRSCEGYATYPTFLINTPKGRERRQHLAEAKPRDPVHSSTSTDAALSEIDELVSGSSSLVISRSGSSDLTSNSSSLTISRPWSPDIEQYQLLANFWSKYVPLRTAAQEASPAPWLEQEIMSFSDSRPALKSALRALAMTRLGWLHDDDALTVRGRANYGSALTHVQKALYDSSEWWRDETLACAHCLSIYELYESTVYRGWHNHVMGLGHLIKMRGPENYESDLARATLYGFGFSCMIHCIQFRRRTFLNSPEWRSIPWKNHTKDIHFRLYEHGFELGALIEKLDKTRLRDPPHPEAVFELNRGFQDLDDRLDTWYEQFLDEFANAITFPEYPQPFHFSQLRVAITFLLFWALKTVLTYARPTSEDNIAPLGDDCDPLPIDTLIAAGRVSKEREIVAMRMKKCVISCTNILRAVPYLLKDDMGLLGAQQAVFPIRVALSYLTKHGGEELVWCQQVYELFNKRKGLKYAESIKETTWRPT